MQPIASTSKLATVLPTATYKAKPNTTKTSAYLQIHGALPTTLPNDIRRYLGKLNVPSDRIKKVVRSLTDEYTPSDLYIVECTTQEAAEDAVASASAVKHTALRLFGGPAARVRFTSAAHLRHIENRRELLHPNFSGRAVRISGIPKEALMQDVHYTLRKAGTTMIEAPLPIWYWAYLHHDWPGRKVQNLAATLTPLKSLGSDFVSYLVRLESEAHAYELVRKWHHRRREWDSRTPAERREGVEGLWTPAFRLSCQVVY